MQMTNGEIVANFRQSKNKREQLKILAELNTCSQEDIKKILIDGGIDPKKIPITRSEKKKDSGKSEYVAPMVEIDEETDVKKPSDIILEALQLMKKDIESRIKDAEDRFAHYIKDQSSRLKKIDEIIGGIE